MHVGLRHPASCEIRIAERSLLAVILAASVERAVVKQFAIFFTKYCSKLPAKVNSKKQVLSCYPSASREQLLRDYKTTYSYTCFGAGNQEHGVPRSNCSSDVLYGCMQP